MSDVPGNKKGKGKRRNRGSRGRGRGGQQSQSETKQVGESRQDSGVEKSRDENSEVSVQDVSHLQQQYRLDLLQNTSGELNVPTNVLATDIESQTNLKRHRPVNLKKHIYIFLNLINN